jgi:predicted permease
VLFQLRPGVRRFFRLGPHSSERIRAEFDDELEALIASRVEQLMQRGMSADDARREALRRLGATLDEVRNHLRTSAHQRGRKMRLIDWIESIAQDVHYAGRGLARRPVFTAVAVTTLAVGIGATTAIFSAVNALLLRSLPYANPDELMKVSTVMPGKGDRPTNFDQRWSYPKFTFFRDAQRAFSELALYEDMQATLTDGDAERIGIERVGATYLRVLGLKPVVGRDFDRTLDAAPGGPHQVLLSYDLWRRRYNSSPSVVGRTVQIGSEGWTVVGVTPPGFRGLTGQAQVFTLLTAMTAHDLGDAQLYNYWLVVRRAPGVTAAQAEAATVALGPRVSDAFPSEFQPAPWGALAAPLDDARLEPAIKRSLLILFGSVGFVLLIACVNVASLLLGRAGTRGREIAVRLALGAGRGRLVRLLVTESLLLALIGAVASVGVAWLGIRALSTIDPATTLRVSREIGFGAMAFSSITLSWSALAFTLGVSVAVGILFGLAPVSATRADLTEALKTGRTSGATRAPITRRLLVLTEVSLAVVLLAGAGLMIRTLGNLLRVNPGFDAAHVLSLRLSTRGSADSMPGFYQRLDDRLRAVPGVTDVALGSCAPLTGGCSSSLFGRLDRPKVDVSMMPRIRLEWVSTKWFSTLHVPLKRGRQFTVADRVGAPNVAIVNEAAARAFWPNENPIGKHMAIGLRGYDDVEVVGIAGDVRLNIDSLAPPVAILPILRAPRAAMMIFVRSTRDPASLAPEVRNALRELAPQAPVYDIQSLTDRSAAATAQTRFSTTLLALFALTALLLAAIGIYGVMALAVAARTREIGIRMALGADGRRIERAVIGEGVGLVAIGAAIGVGVAIASTRVLRSLLFDLSPTDPITYAAIVALIGVTAVAASWLPARRAASIDPLSSLRAE